MEIVPILSTIILIATVITLVVAIASYLTFRIKERRREARAQAALRSKGKTPIKEDAEKPKLESEKKESALKPDVHPTSRRTFDRRGNPAYVQREVNPLYDRRRLERRQSSQPDGVSYGSEIPRIERRQGNQPDGVPYSAETPLLERRKSNQSDGVPYGVEIPRVERRKSSQPEGVPYGAETPRVERRKSSQSGGESYGAGIPIGTSPGVTYQPLHAETQNQPVIQPHQQQAQQYIQPQSSQYPEVPTAAQQPLMKQPETGASTDVKTGTSIVVNPQIVMPDGRSRYSKKQPIVTPAQPEPTVKVNTAADSTPEVKPGAETENGNWDEADEEQLSDVQTAFVESLNIPDAELDAPPKKEQKNSKRSSEKPFSTGESLKLRRFTISGNSVKRKTSRPGNDKLDWK